MGKRFHKINEVNRKIVRYNRETTVHKTFTPWGRHGFDVDYKALGACRGTDYLVNPTVKLLVANDDNYALAA